MPLLDRINSPADLKQLNMEELTSLAAEIRTEIITTMSENGGHLASNLGAVELTLALHYVLDTPYDKLLWDVGHQCYTHKLVTGRRKNFRTVRKDGGISGFCNREESEYDLFTTGHSSESVSLALGYAQSRVLNGEHYRVAAVLGDGALTGGMALEALDHAGDTELPILVVLNDNEMSIDGNVGGLSRKLSRFRANPNYYRAKLRAKKVLSHVPILGELLTVLASMVKRAVKAMFVQDTFFEDMGFFYQGPIDGHDLPTLVEMIREAVAQERPVLLHVRTVKGKGYAPAEEHPESWHGCAPFDIETGKPKKSGGATSFTGEFSAALLELAEQDDRICAVTAAMKEGAGLKSFAAAYPHRCFDTGITEQHAAGFAAGLAASGLRPVLAIYSTFLQRAYDQLMENICLQKLPVVVAVDRAGVVGGDGFSHQGIFDLSYLRTMPGMHIVAPSDGEELRLLLAHAFTLDAPIAIRYPREAAEPVAAHPHPPVETGKSVLLREGADCAIVAVGSMVQTALLAADILAAEGISVQVTDARFVAPLDLDALLASVKVCKGRIVTLEENVADGGFGEACRAALAASDVACDLFSIALPKRFLPHSDRSLLLSRCGLDPETVATRIRMRWFPLRDEA